MSDQAKKLPTIAELEAILNQPDGMRVVVLNPDGSLKTELTGAGKLVVDLQERVAGLERDNQELAKRARTANVLGLEIERDGLQERLATLEAQLAQVSKERDVAITELGKISRQQGRELGGQDVQLQTLTTQVRRMTEVLQLSKEAILAEQFTHGHAHWDTTMRHGAGCEICILQIEASKKSHIALQALDAALQPPREETDG